jgi:peptidoglycan/LPS O-acetylase OafA/YrhL
MTGLSTARSAQTGARHLPGHIPELDGVRGIAILLVLITHFSYYSSAPDTFRQILHGMLDFGWTGVDLFLVLSGFLITGILLDAKGSDAYFRGFYMRRVLRILPLYYVSITLYFFVLVPVLQVVTPHTATVAIASQLPASEKLWYFLHLSNWRIARDIYFNGIDHFWSLAIEEQFYLVWPFIVFLASGRALLRISFFAIAASIALRNLPAVQAVQAVHHGFIYCLTPFRVEPLAWGAVVALLVRQSGFERVWRGWTAAACVAGSALLGIAIAASGSVSANSAPMTRLGYSGVALLYAAVVCYAAERSGAGAAGARALRNPLLVEFGRLSYGIYVLHRPFSTLVAHGVTTLSPHTGFALATVTVAAAGIVASYLAARISWRFVEQPFLRLKSRFPYQSVKPARAEAAAAARPATLAPDSVA